MVKFTDEYFSLFNYDNDDDSEDYNDDDEDEENITDILEDGVILDDDNDDDDWWGDNDNYRQIDDGYCNYQRDRARKALEERVEESLFDYDKDEDDKNDASEDEDEETILYQLLNDGYDWIDEKGKKIKPPELFRDAEDDLNAGINMQQNQAIPQNELQKGNISLDLAERIVKRLKVVSYQGEIYIWNGRFYEKIGVRKDIEGYILEHFREELRFVETAVVTRRAAELLRIERALIIPKFQNPTNLIVFLNKTYDLSCNKFRENSPDDLVTSCLNFDPNEDYNEKINLPNIQKFLIDVSGGNKKIMSRMLQTIAYCMTNDMEGKCFFFCCGKPHTGKSKFCQLIEALFEEKFRANTKLQDFDKQFALGNHDIVKINVHDDLPNKVTSPEAVSQIKILTGTGAVMLERKGVDPKRSTVQFKLVFASNHPLSLKEEDEAFLDRVVYIPFNHPVPREDWDTNLLSKMIPELPKLVPTLISEYKKLRENGYEFTGYNDPEFDPPVVYCHGNNLDVVRTVTEFAEARCVLNENFKTYSSELVNAYEKFCEEKRYKSVYRNVFTKTLKTLYPHLKEFKDTGGARGLYGIGVK